MLQSFQCLTNSETLINEFCVPSHTHTGLSIAQQLIIHLQIPLQDAFDMPTLLSAWLCVFNNVPIPELEYQLLIKGSLYLGPLNKFTSCDRLCALLWYFCANCVHVVIILANSAYLISLRTENVGLSAREGYVENM